MVELDDELDIRYRAACASGPEGAGMGIRETLDAMLSQFQAELRDAPLPPPTEDDEATARLLAAAAIHHFSNTGTFGDVQGATATMLQAWDESDRLEGLTQMVVMQYAREHASAEDQAALRRWLKAMN